MLMTLIGSTCAASGEWTLHALENLSKYLEVHIELKGYTKHSLLRGCRWI